VVDAASLIWSFNYIVAFFCTRHEFVVKFAVSSAVVAAGVGAGVAGFCVQFADVAKFAFAFPLN
jgi:hypothetical protein